MKPEEMTLVKKILDILNTFKTEDEIASDLNKSAKELTPDDLVSFRTNNGELKRCKLKKLTENGNNLSLDCRSMVDALGIFQAGAELEILGNLSLGEFKSNVIERCVQNFNFSKNKIQINRKNGGWIIFELQNQVNLKVSCHFVIKNAGEYEAEFILSKSEI